MSKRTIDRQALAMRIRELEGLTNQEKSDLLELLNSQKKYGLVWEDKPEQVEEELRSKIPVFTEVKNRAIINDIPTEHYPNHLLIEGDNLQALTTLAYTHEGKIDVIYIDPPYNTGKEDEFKYNDKYIDAEDAFRHSKWLAFMSKRLSVARRLLSDNGLIFISIDDNEIAQLKCLCDEIYGLSNNPKMSNCLGVLVWNLGTGTQAGHFTRSHEYILVYAKNKGAIENFKGGSGLIDHSALKKISKKNPPLDFSFKAGTKFSAPDGTELTGSWGGSEKTELLDGRMIAENGKLKYDVTLRAGFAMANQMRSWFCGENTVDSKGQNVIDFYFNKSGVLHYIKEKSKINPSTVINEVGSTKTGSIELSNILGLGSVDMFGYPKPTTLISFLIGLGDTNATILDFFAGSGTTLHATMQLNAEDGGHRQCILVTNNENNICEEVTYERNKRVIQGYTTPKGEKVEGLHANNLRYYKTELVERDNSQQNRKALMKASADLLCIKEDIYTEKDELNGTKFNKQYIRFYQDGDRSMLLVFDPRAIDSVVERLGGMAFAHPVKVYVYSADEYPYTDDFAPVADKVQLVALPTALRKALQNVLPADGPQRPVEGMEPAADATAGGDLFNQPTGEE
ncbi:MAG: site-specific DNA-methyltransferase [Paludibacteraceae bacterium]|nr:site-specific DNA-methyltransferase [Paludibacteraceae bacterium]